MIEKEKWKRIQTEYAKAHTLTPEQLHQLIQDKLARAAQQARLNRQREALLGGR